MDVDPDSYDPELRFARLYAVASAAFGVISLCAGIIPLCGSITSVLGVVFGVLSLRIEKSNSAKAGVFLSILGALITVVYFFILLYFR